MTMVIGQKQTHAGLNFASLQEGHGYGKVMVLQGYGVRLGEVLVPVRL